VPKNVGRVGENIPDFFVFFIISLIKLPHLFLIDEDQYYLMKVSYFKSDSKNR
jgi:hypothetical protein